MLVWYDTIINLVCSMMSINTLEGFLDDLCGGNIASLQNEGIVIKLISYLL